MKQFKCHLQVNSVEQGVVVHSLNPRTWKAEIGESLWVRDHPGLHSKFQDSQGYIVRLCLKKKVCQNCCFLDNRKRNK